MHRIDNDTADVSLPTPAAVGPHPNSYFTKGNPSTGTPATVVTDDWANAVQEEICYVIEQAGLTLNKTVRTQLLQAIELISQKDIALYTTSTTAANTYTATLSPVPAAYTAGMIAFVLFTNHNTGSATINFNGLGAKTIKNLANANLLPGDIYDGMVGALIYDGTNVRLLSGATVIKRVISTLYTTSGTYTPTTGMIYAKVEVAGGGGGGGASSNTAASTGSAAAGGGGGGYAQSIFSAATIGASQTITIGAAGAAGTTPGNNGGAGGTTSLGALISATGGLGGTGAAASTNADIAGATGGTGSGSINKTGGSGGCGSNNGGLNGVSGYGGSSHMSGSVAGVVSASFAGNAALIYGGGGSGAVSRATGTANPGGLGAAGCIIITEYLNQ